MMKTCFVLAYTETHLPLTFFYNTSIGEMLFTYDEKLRVWIIHLCLK